MVSISDFRFRADTGSTRVTANMVLESPSDYLAASMAARKSMSDIVKRYGEFAEYIEGVTPDVMLLAMREAYDLSQIYVPVETGRLKASGYLIITNRGKKPQVEIGYGRNNDPDYAGIQHENLEYRHTPPQRAKYLQAALEESYGTVWHTIIAILSQAISSGININSLKAKQIVPQGVRVR